MLKKNKNKNYGHGMCFNVVLNCFKLKIIPQRLGRLDSLNTDRGRRKIKLAEPKLSLKRETPRVLGPMKKQSDDALLIGHRLQQHSSLMKQNLTTIFCNTKQPLISCN